MARGSAANGFFGGLLDEARIWNTARTQGQIQASMNTPITSPTAGLLARYGLNEGTGTAVGDSIAPAENGTAQPTANAPSWAAGAPALDGDVTAPAAPTGLAATSGEGNVALDWNDNGEGDLAGYNVYRGTSSPVSTAGSPLNGGTPLAPRSIDDTTGTPGTTYFYVVTAEDTSGNESDASNEVSDSPDPFSQAALQFDGTNDHVTLGSAPGLSATNFTLEAWIKKTGAGATVSTGSQWAHRRPTDHQGTARSGRHDRRHELLPRSRRDRTHRRRLRGLREPRTTTTHSPAGRCGRA